MFVKVRNSDLFFVTSQKCPENALPNLIIKVQWPTKIAKAHHSVENLTKKYDRLFYMKNIQSVEIYYVFTGDRWGTARNMFYGQCT